jgi:hypothetical protein
MKGALVRKQWKIRHACAWETILKKEKEGGKIK